jgi:hypothetical protein
VATLDHGRVRLLFLDNLFSLERDMSPHLLTAELSSAKRTGAEEFLEQLDRLGLAGNFSSRKDLTADNPKILRIPRWRPALLLTLRRKDRFELFFEGGWHGQAFDDHVVQSGPGDRV